MGTILFTHIPKTAGTSLRLGVFNPNVSDSHSPSGYRSALATQGSFDLVEGHFPYGLHYLYWIENPRYFVILRDPVDRAISHYYFIKACDGPSYVHPRIEDARENDLVDFYRKAEYQNMQTRFVAGLGWEYAGRYISMNGWLGRRALARAKRNLLEQYEAYGIKERFRDSAQLFATRLSASADILEKQHKKTPNRPTASELPDATAQELRQSNALDVALYRFATDHFDEQFDV
ncbi:hypothetical protein GGP62_003215 [Salinibacter ruber]|uniref:sulfotransferase family protein n=1 Tax=Salinibacter ruber TaxID=146919 RepID=UPI002167FA28|nr:sulfotransferase family protein [Salinibacter ruber]MCS3708305.1 hypothetical protein [Salinibacter ruber]